MWHWLLGYYVLQIAVLAVLVILSLLFWDKRYKKRRNQSTIPEGYERTEEVNIDPTTQEKQRVYFNKTTGDRLYVQEN